MPTPEPRDPLVVLRRKRLAGKATPAEIRALDGYRLIDSAIASNDPHLRAMWLAAGLRHFAEPLESPDPSPREPGDPIEWLRENCPWLVGIDSQIRIPNPSEKE
jgi:hypothetical protein